MIKINYIKNKTNGKKLLNIFIYISKNSEYIMDYFVHKYEFDGSEKINQRVLVMLCLTLYF